MADTTDELSVSGRRARLSRRRFLTVAGGAVVGGGVFAVAARGRGTRTASGERLSAAGGALAGSVAASLYSHDSFAAHRGDAFQVRSGDGRSAELTLDEVSRWQPPESAGDGPRPGEHFTLSFRGPIEPALGQDTYQFQHPSIGAVALFIVPGAAAADARSYVAVINRPAF